MYRAELVNGELTAQERISRGFRSPIPIYLHNEVRQGHTLNGMLLGTDDAFTGSSARLTLDDYTPSGRRSISLFHQLRLDWLPGIADPQSVHYPDVILGARYELMRFDNGRDYTMTVMPTYELNHDLVPGKGLANLTLGFGVRGWR